MIITPRLKLRSPEGTDNFLRDDFVFNLAQLDAAPGISAGLSTGRPTWDASQGGRVFLETDTQRFVIWTGSAWIDALGNPQSFGSVLTTPAVGTPAVGSNAAYAFPTITLTRPSIICGDVSVNWYCPGTTNPELGFNVRMDGATVGLRVVYGRHVAVAGGSNAWYETTIPFRTGLLAAGTHTPAVYIATVVTGATVQNASFTGIATV